MSPPETCLGPVWVAKPDLKHRLPLAWRWRLLVVLTLGLVGCFARPLWALCGHAWHNDLYSHILLVPFISLYFAVAKYRVVALEPQPKFQLSLLLPGWAGLCLLRLSSLKIPFGDYLALATTSLLLLLLGTAVVLLGWRNVGQFAFPIGFSFFAVPLPDSAVRLIEGFLQRHSADVASALFTVSGTPLVRDDTAFQLPGFFLEVAPECSGIHSTLALFITSIVAGYVLLRRPWTRTVLVLTVVPLALLRNGFRVFVIGRLCVRLGPDMIDSPIHRKGGPLFFLLSLIPLFLLLRWLRRTESRHLRSRPDAPAGTFS